MGHVTARERPQNSDVEANGCKVKQEFVESHRIARAEKIDK
jgi:hypothetical protein